MQRLAETHTRNLSPETEYNARTNDVITIKGKPMPKPIARIKLSENNTPKQFVLEQNITLFATRSIK